MGHVFKLFISDIYFVMFASVRVNCLLLILAVQVDLIILKDTDSSNSSQNDKIVENNQQFQGTPNKGNDEIQNDGTDIEKTKDSTEQHLNSTVEVKNDFYDTQATEKYDRELEQIEDYFHKTEEIENKEFEIKNKTYDTQVIELYEHEHELEQNKDNIHEIEETQNNDSQILLYAEENFHEIKEIENEESIEIKIEDVIENEFIKIGETTDDETKETEIEETNVDEIETMEKDCDDDRVQDNDECKKLTLNDDDCMEMTEHCDDEVGRQVRQSCFGMTGDYETPSSSVYQAWPCYYFLPYPTFPVILPVPVPVPEPVKVPVNVPVAGKVQAAGRVKLIGHFNNDRCQWGLPNTVPIETATSSFYDTQMYGKQVYDKQINAKQVYDKQMYNTQMYGNMGMDANYLGNYVPGNIQDTNCEYPVKSFKVPLQARGRVTIMGHFN